MTGLRRHLVAFIAVLGSTGAFAGAVALTGTGGYAWATDMVPDHMVSDQSRRPRKRVSAERSGRQLSSDGRSSQFAYNWRRWVYSWFRGSYADEPVPLAMTTSWLGRVGRGI